MAPVSEQRPTSVSVLRGYVATGAYVALATAGAWSARTVLALPDLVALYLLVIMLVAVRHGRGPAIFASACSVVAYDVFFIAPLYAIRVDDPRHLLTFALMFVVGLLISNLVRRIRRQEDEVAKASLRARTEEIRSSLLSAVSHDLRTPLACITGAGALLREDEAPLSAADRRELALTVCQEADRLERLVANLLEMTRLEAGPIEIKRAWVPLEEIVGSALARLGDRIGSRAVVTHLPEQLVLAPVDPVLIEHALLNLLENALKHAPGESEIAITAQERDGQIEIEVADRGPGLPADPEPLFEKFVRHAPTSVPGAGLGLAIARGIARAHDGELVAGNRPGGGAIFSLRVPIGRDRPPLTPDEQGEAVS